MEKQGYFVFNQISYLDYSLEQAPFDYAKKFKIFYKGLIKSGKIREVFLLPDWDKSLGTQTEVRYCEEFGVMINLP